MSVSKHPIGSFRPGGLLISICNHFLFPKKPIKNIKSNISPIYLKSFCFRADYYKDCCFWVGIRH